MKTLRYIFCLFIAVISLAGCDWWNNGNGENSGEKLYSVSGSIIADSEAYTDSARSANPTFTFGGCTFDVTAVNLDGSKSYTGSVTANSYLISLPAGKWNISIQGKKNSKILFTGETGYFEIYDGDPSFSSGREVLMYPDYVGINSTGTSGTVSLGIKKGTNVSLVIAEWKDSEGVSKKWYGIFDASYNEYSITGPITFRMVDNSERKSSYGDGMPIDDTLVEKTLNQVNNCLDNGGNPLVRDINPDIYEVVFKFYSDIDRKIRADTLNSNCVFRLDDFDFSSNLVAMSKQTIRVCAGYSTTTWNPCDEAVTTESGKTYLTGVPF